MRYMSCSLVNNAQLHRRLEHNNNAAGNDKNKSDIWNDELHGDLFGRHKNIKGQNRDGSGGVKVIGLHHADRCSEIGNVCPVRLAREKSAIHEADWCHHEDWTYFYPVIHSPTLSWQTVLHRAVIYMNLILEQYSQRTVEEINSLRVLLQQNQSNSACAHMHVQKKSNQTQIIENSCVGGGRNVSNNENACFFPLQAQSSDALGFCVSV